MGYRYEKRYTIKKISEDGLLKTPENRWGGDAFSSSYETEEEAISAIERNANFDNLAIIPVLSRQYYMETHE